MHMTDNKPYLMRAIYEWICDNGMTPYLYVDTSQSNLIIPDHLYGDNPLILNISKTACQNLNISNEKVSFQARFSGQVFDLFIPVSACLAVIARENGLGMSFEVQAPKDDAENEVLTKQPSSESDTAKKAGHLKIIR